MEKGVVCKDPRSISVGGSKLERIFSVCLGNKRIPVDVQEFLVSPCFLMNIERTVMRCYPVIETNFRTFKIYSQILK